MITHIKNDGKILFNNSDFMIDSCYAVVVLKRFLDNCIHVEFVDDRINLSKTSANIIKTLNIPSESLECVRLNYNFKFDCLRCEDYILMLIDKDFNILDYRPTIHIIKHHLEKIIA